MLSVCYQIYISNTLYKNMLSTPHRYSILFDQYFGEGKPSKATLLLNQNSDRKKEGVAMGTE